MKEEKRLPRTRKEGLLYGAIIAAITATIMCTINIAIAFGRFDKEVLLIILKSIPLMWIVAMLLESLVIGNIAESLVNKFSESTDGFNAKILFNILFCVLGMSALMTIIGGMAGEGISLHPFVTFPSHWPTNFCIALWCEILLAQPVARLVMQKIHTVK